MNLPSAFCSEAREAFRESRIDGTFEGIGIDADNKASIIYSTPNGALAKMPWENAAGKWEGIYRTMTSSYN